jgi:N-acetylmuramoyl-L-alanine amidase
VSNALNQSKTEQDSLVERINALEKAKNEALDQINQLKTDAENAKNEINQLKTYAEHAKSEIEDLKEQQKEPEDKIRIYIDQGHNPAPYHNTGASGNGLHEQDITFLIGCVLADLLKTDGRFEIELSRPNRSVVLGTDNNTSLEARVKGATDFNADYFISLHTNSFTADTANGIEVYVMEEGSESYAFG